MVLLEPDSAAKSPFRLLTDTQEPPKLVSLREFIGEFPDPIAKDPVTWALLDYIVAKRKHLGVTEKVHAAVVETSQRTYRKEQATQEKKL